MRSRSAARSTRSRAALVHLRLQLTLRDERPLAVPSLPLEPLRVVELLPSARLLPASATHSEPPRPRRLPTATLGLGGEHARMELQHVLGGRAACVDGEHLRRRPTKTGHKSRDRIGRRRIRRRELRSHLVLARAQVEPVALAPAAERHVRPLPAHAGVREHEGPVDRQPLGDVPGDGVSVQQRRLPLTRRARQEAGVQLDQATTDLDAQRASLRIGRGNRASIAVLDVERQLVALHDNPITDGKRTAAELQLLIPEPAGLP